MDRKNHGKCWKEFYWVIERKIEAKFKITEKKTLKIVNSQFKWRKKRKKNSYIYTNTTTQV